MSEPRPQRSPLRVVHVITGLSGGGAEGFLARLVPRLRDQGVDATVVSLTDDGAHGEPLRRQGFDVVPLGLDPARPRVRPVLRLASHLRDLRPDVVMTWLPHADVVGGLTARLCGVPVVWNVRQSALGPEAPRRHHRLVAATARLSRWVPTRIACVSEAARRDHVALGYPAARTEVVPNGFDLDRFRPDPARGRDVRAGLGLDPDTHVVGHAARLDPQKDHRTLLEAFGIVAAARSDVRFVLCGRGVTPTSEPLRTWVDELLPPGRAQLLGPREDLPQLLTAWDVAVSSSAYGEGLTNALGEAMSCGVPCVATDSGAARELLGGTGRVVPVRDPSALAAAVLDVLDGPRPPVAAVRRHVAGHFGIDAAADRYAGLLRSAADRGRVRR